MNPKKLLLRFFLYLAMLCIAVYVLWITLHNHELSRDPKQDAAEQQPLITMRDITLRERTKNNEYDIVISAQESSLSHVADNIQSTNITCSVLHNNQHIAILRTQKSLIDRTSKNIFFQGSVDGRFKDVDFQGYDLTYDFSHQTVHTTQAITYQHPLFTLRAEQSFIDIQEQKIAMDGGVRSEILGRPAANHSGQ